MYKIHINDTPLTIVSGKDGDDYNQAMKQGSLVAPFPGKKKFLLHYIDLLEKNADHQGVVLVASDVEDAIQVMESLFVPMDAAGGLVKRNRDGKFLFIFRRGRWDLPKGKVDEGESNREAALREVTEETNLSDVTITGDLGVTRHTYKIKSKRILKLTHWYSMSSEGTNTVPQEEEDITDIRWLSLEEFKEESYETYQTITELLKVKDANE